MTRWPITWRSRRWRTQFWRWPTVTPPTVPPVAPPTFTDAPTETNSPLGDRLPNDESAEWSEMALRSCLDHLRIGTVTEAHEVVVHDAWVDGPNAFCVVYRNPYFDGLIGIRRHADDALEAIKGRWVAGRSMTASYDMAEASVLQGRQPDPIAFGRNVAAFDIGEPHSPTQDFRSDESGVRWHGNLDNGVPVRR